MAGLWVGYRTRSEGRRTNFHTLVVANIRKRAQSIARRVTAKLGNGGGNILGLADSGNIRGLVIGAISC